MDDTPRTATMHEIREAYVIRRMEQAAEISAKYTPTGVFHDEFERGFNEAVELAVKARTAGLEEELEELREDRDRYRREAGWRQFRESVLTAALERSRPVRVKHLLLETGVWTLCGAMPDTSRPAPGDHIEVCKSCARVAFETDSGLPERPRGARLDNMPTFSVTVRLTSVHTGHVMEMRAGGFQTKTRVIGSGKVEPVLTVEVDRNATTRALAAVLRNFVNGLERA